MARQSPIVHPVTEGEAPILCSEHMYARYARRIRRHVQAVLGSDHEQDDLVQEVLLIIITKVNTVRDPACLDWWVARVTANAVKQLARRRRVRCHASLEDVAESLLPSVQTDFSARDLASRVREVMSSLPPKDRSLLMTYWLSAATAETIAAAAGCSVVTMRRKLSRAQSRFERLARRDPALAQSIDGGRRWSRRSRPPPSGFFPASTSAPTEALPATRKLVA